MAAYLDSSRTKTLRTSDGTNYAYYHQPASSPSKPVLLLLHGYPSSANDWRRCIPLFEDAGFGIIAPDLLGYGGTDKPSDPARYRMQIMSAHINDILEHEKLSKVVAVSHDWGSGLLSRLVLYYPTRFTACTFISVPYLPPAPLDIDAINQATKASLGWEIFGYWDVLKRDEAAAMIENNYDAYESISWAANDNDTIQHFASKGGLEAFLNDGTKTCPTADWLPKSELETHRKIILDGGYTGPTCWYKQSVRGLSNVDDESFSEDEKKIKMPTQFVAAMRDVVCAPSMMMTITKPWVENLTITEIQSGHWPQLEMPKKLAEAVIAYIDSVTTS